MKTKLLICLLAIASFLPHFANASDFYYHYHYVMVAEGAAPNELSIEGFQSPTFATNCKVDATAHTTRCEGDLDAISVLSIGSVFVTAGENTGDIQISITQRCSPSQSLPVTELPATIQHEYYDPIGEGLLYDKLDAGLNPCKLP
jgi:hypothetical protein